MVLSKDELIGCLDNEVRLLLHLASKVDPAQLAYRPTAGQRSTLELLQYLAIMGPIHLRGIQADSFDMDAWRTAWNTGEATAKGMSLQEAKDAIGSQQPFFAELIGSFSDADLHAEIEMFAHKASRGVTIVNLVLSHLTAYRMQLFLYLKASGQESLSTMNLWVGRDSK
jgi:hypothetical protein